MTLNGVNYYYIKNAQGDVVRICDESGNIVITYNYDAWGNLVNFSGSVVLFLANPFRYRGYYYDLETGFYYLNSRYYDPAVGRFINADSILGANQDIQAYNLFAYCSNNPVILIMRTTEKPHKIKENRYCGNVYMLNKVCMEQKAVRTLLYMKIIFQN